MIKISRKSEENFAKKSDEKSQNSGRKFVIVGIANTFLDFGLMNIFSLFLLAPIPNFLSTGIAMISSFYFNKKWTFSSKTSSRKALARQTLMFFIFTAIGIWIIQTPLMWAISTGFLRIFPHFSLVFFHHDFAKFFTENFAKVIASIFSLTWNFLTYKRFVFAGKSSKQAEESGEISGL